MDSQITTLKTIKCNSPQNPTSNVRSYSTQTNSTFKDASFSSHSTPKHSKLNNRQDNISGETKELSIFDAHKYFSETNNNNNNNSRSDNINKLQEPSHDLLISVSRISSVSSVDGYGNFRTRSYRSTPTTSSEASWNSRTGLLSNPPSSIAVSLRKSPLEQSSNARRTKKWFLGRKCCCAGGESVQVKTMIPESEHKGPVITSIKPDNHNQSRSNKAKTPRIQSGRSSFTKEILEIHQNKARISASGRPFLDGPVSNFTFPIINKSSSDQGINVVKAIINPPDEDRLRHSLEGLSMENLVNCRGPFNQGSPIAREDDMGSDASSDLFEIESFSTQTTSYATYRRRDSVDEEPSYNYARRFASAKGINNGGRSVEEEPPPSVAGSEGYPPSEVSIVWSVATSEGYDGRRVTNFSTLRQRVEEAGGGDGGKSKGNGLMLMGCRQEKAVSVGPQAVKCPAEGRPPRANKPPLGSSNSARLSLAFAA